MDARSVGMDDKQYEDMKAQLAERIRARTPLLVTLAQCPAGETASSRARDPQAGGLRPGRLRRRQGALVSR